MNAWEILPFKLHRGIECGLCFPGGHNNTFFLFGGNMQKGPVDSVNLYDFSSQTVHTKKFLKTPRVL